MFLEGGKVHKPNQENMQFCQKMQFLDNNKEQQSQGGTKNEVGMDESGKACSAEKIKNKAQIRVQTSKVLTMYILIEHLCIRFYSILMQKLLEFMMEK